MTAINVAPDAVYGKIPVKIRFTVDVEMAEKAMQHRMLEATATNNRALYRYAQEAAQRAFLKAAREAIKKGVAQWIRVNPKHTLLESEGLRIDPSPFQGDPDKLHDATGGGRPLNYQDRRLKDGLLDYVATVYFSGPLEWVVKPEYRDVPGPNEGFKDFNDLDDEAKSLIRDKYRVAASALEKESA